MKGFLKLLFGLKKGEKRLEESPKDNMNKKSRFLKNKNRSVCTFQVTPIRNMFFLFMVIILFL